MAAALKIVNSHPTSRTNKSRVGSPHQKKLERIMDEKITRDQIILLN